ncbi:hypothetical protein BC940DRAFT_173564 [Gongronella butleri]|nr:hypothetical protein BC940DRAFT_173564 [Gongronella butleri]
MGRLDRLFLLFATCPLIVLAFPPLQSDMIHELSLDEWPVEEEMAKLLQQEQQLGDALLDDDDFGADDGIGGDGEEEEEEEDDVDNDDDEIMDDVMLETADDQDDGDEPPFSPKHPDPLFANAPPPDLELELAALERHPAPKEPEQAPQDQWQEQSAQDTQNDAYPAQNDGSQQQHPVHSVDKDTTTTFHHTPDRALLQQEQQRVDDMDRAIIASLQHAIDQVKNNRPIRYIPLDDSSSNTILDASLSSVHASWSLTSTSTMAFSLLLLSLVVCMTWKGRHKRDSRLPMYHQLHPRHKKSSVD